MRTNLQTFAAAEIRPRSYLEPLDVRAIFERDAPLEVDLGCGDGTFLVASAAVNPERNFIGVERMPGRVRSACRKIGSASLTNARVVEHDVLQAVQQLFAPSSVDTFYLLFSDPWPKRRHHNRRVVTPSFLRAVWRALKADGLLQIATDDAPYFAAIGDTIASSPEFARGRDERPLPTTTFEERFRGRTIYRLALRKVSSRRNGFASQ